MPCGVQLAQLELAMPALAAANAFVAPVRPQILPRTALGGAAGAASSAQGSLTAGVVFALAGLSLARPVSGQGISHACSWSLCSVEPSCPQGVSSIHPVCLEGRADVAVAWLF